VLLLCTVTDFFVHDVSTHKTSFQVSTDGQKTAWYANDGDEHTCAASNPGTNPWWAVDLGGPTLVFMVKLSNSGDGKGTLNLYDYVVLNATVSGRCFTYSQIVLPVFYVKVHVSYFNSVSTGIIFMTYFCRQKPKAYYILFSSLPLFPPPCIVFLGSIPMPENLETLSLVHIKACYKKEKLQ